MPVMYVASSAGKHTGILLQGSNQNPIQKPTNDRAEGTGDLLPGALNKCSLLSRLTQGFKMRLSLTLELLNSEAIFIMK